MEEELLRLENKYGKTLTVTQIDDMIEAIKLQKAEDLKKVKEKLDLILESNKDKIDNLESDIDNDNFIVKIEEKLKEKKQLLDDYFSLLLSENVSESEIFKDIKYIELSDQVLELENIIYKIKNGNINSYDQIEYKEKVKKELELVNINCDAKINELEKLKRLKENNNILKSKIDNVNKNFSYTKDLLSSSIIPDEISIDRVEHNKKLLSNSLSSCNEILNGLKGFVISNNGIISIKNN